METPPSPNENPLADELAKLRERRKHLLEWKSRYKSAQQMLPYLDRQLELTELSIQALTDLPEEAQDIPHQDLAPLLDQENDRIKFTFGLMPQYDPEDAKNSTNLLVSGSTASISVIVSRTLQVGTEAAQTFAYDYSNRLQAIQASQSREATIRDLLNRLPHDAPLKSLDAAQAAFAGWRSQTVEASAAASELRNLIYKLKGELFDLARNQPGENMTWERMAHRLAKGNQEKEALLRQEKLQLLILPDLSHMAKARTAPLPKKLEYLWSQTLDHVFSILVSINYPPSP